MTTAATPFHPAHVRALAFDVFGTVVDWRSSIIREGQALSRAKSQAVDWPAFADAWRAGYQPAMAKVRSGEIAWARIDDLHRSILDGLLPRFGLYCLDPHEVEHLNFAWHRLDPWPDAVAGLERLRSRFVISTLSNGNVSLLVDIARHARLPWDCVLSAELFRRYKPDLDVYRGAAALLDVAPGELLMVAAHPSDLAAAQRAGLRTAYVRRPLEHGAGAAAETLGDLHVDVTAADFGELAELLGT